MEDCLSQVFVLGPVSCGQGSRIMGTKWEGALCLVGMSRSMPSAKTPCRLAFRGAGISCWLIAKALKKDRPEIGWTLLLISCVNVRKFFDLSSAQFPLLLNGCNSNTYFSL